MDAKTIARFWSKVDKLAGPDRCWIWTAATSSTGYGNFGAGPRGTSKAHRLSWELANGPIHAGLCVCHKCDVPLCVNPAHLFLGTVADNNADKVSKGRASGGSLRGEANRNAKLSWDLVASLRADRSAGMSELALAAKYGVSKSQAHNIVSGKVWVPKRAKASADGRVWVYRGDDTKEARDGK